MEYEIKFYDFNEYVRQQIISSFGIPIDLLKEHISNEPNPCGEISLAARPCDCSTQTLMRTGCKCGGT